jgi:hypothetical protein
MTLRIATFEEQNRYTSLFPQDSAHLLHYITAKRQNDRRAVMSQRNSTRRIQQPGSKCSNPKPSPHKKPTGYQVKAVLEQRMNLDIGIDGLRGITDECRSYQTETHHRPAIASQKLMIRFRPECIGKIWLLWIRSGKLAKHGIHGGGRVS